VSARQQRDDRLAQYMLVTTVHGARGAAAGRGGGRGQQLAGQRVEGGLLHGGHLIL
jgi:hypothetical protein